MNNPKKYRKRPIEIEAMQFDGDTADTMAVYHWIEANTLGSYDTNAISEDYPVPASGVSIRAEDGAMVIATLEGEMTVSMGDFVIRGVQGEFYPCKPDIFLTTYREVPNVLDENAEDVLAQDIRESLNGAGLDHNAISRILGRLNASGLTIVREVETVEEPQS